MIVDTTKNPILCKWLTDALMVDLCREVELDDEQYQAGLQISQQRFPDQEAEWHEAHAAWMLLTQGRVSKETAADLGVKGVTDLQRYALSAEATNKAFNALRQNVEALSDAYSKEANNLGQIFTETHELHKTVKDRAGMTARVIAGGFASLAHKVELLFGEKKTRDEAARVRESHRDIIDWAWKIAVLGLLTLMAVRGNAQTVTQLRFGSTTLGSSYIDTTNTAIEVSCVVGCSGGTTDTDDGSVASGQSTGIQIGLGYVYNGAAWVRMIGDATNGLTVQCATGCSGGTQYTEDAAAAANPIGSAINLVRQDTPAGLVTTDGDNVSLRGTNYGAAFVQVLNSSGSFVDSFGGGTQYAVDAALGATPTGTLAIAIRDDALSALTPVEGDAIGLRVDANGALWVIPSGTTTVSGTVTVTDGAGSLNVIVDSGSVTADSELPNAAALADNASNPTAPAVGAFGMWWDGATWDRASGTAADGLLVNLGANNDVSITGSVTVTDGAGALNVIVDSGTITTITNAVTVTDGAGALNVICDSGCSGGTQYTEDVAAAADPVGTMGMAVRADTLAAVTTTDGDNIALRATNKGELYVKQTDSVTVTDGSGALNVICDSGCGAAASFSDDSAFTATTTAVNVIAGLYDTTPPTITDGNAGAVRMNSSRVLMVDGSGVTQPVSGTVTANQGGAPWQVQSNSANIATQTTAAAIQTSVELIDDTIATLGTTTYAEATTKGQLAGCVRRDADTSAVNTDNEVAPCIVNANGYLKVEAFSGETLPVSLTSTTITGQVTVGDGTDAVDVEAAGADNIANTLNQLITGAVLYAYDGATYDRVTNGNGTAATAVRVTIASDSTGQVAVASFPDNEPININQIGGVAAFQDRCQREQKTYVAINQTANAQLVTGTASERVYICSFNVVSATAQNVALVSGTGSTCATSTSGLEGFGGATAATGWNFAANGGISYGDGGYTLGRTDTDADNVCVFQSGSGQLSGGFSYVSN